VPAVTVVAKRFTLVQAAQAAKSNDAASFYSKRFASCHIPSLRQFLRFQGCRELNRDIGESQKVYLSPALKGHL